VAFIIGIAIVFLSMIPFAFLPRTDVQYEFGFIETFGKLVSKKYRYLSLSMFAFGVETIVAYAIWPVFLFVIFRGDYLEVGIFSSIIVLVGMLLQVFMGNLTDRKRPKKLLAFGVDLYAFGWIGKAFVQSVGGVFAASTFHMFGSIMMRTPLDTMMYQKAADSGHYVDEFTTIREMAMTFGRVSLLVAMYFLSQHFSLSVAFVIAGLSSFVITLFARVKVGEDFERL
jgi:MFS family permease